MMLDPYTTMTVARIQSDELVTPKPHVGRTSVTRTRAAHPGNRFRHFASSQRLRRD